MGSTLGKAGSRARPGIAGPGRPGGLGWVRDVTAVAKFIGFSDSDHHGVKVTVAGPGHPAAGLPRAAAEAGTYNEEKLFC